MARVRSPRLQDLAWRAEALGFDALSFLLRRLPLRLVSAFGGGLFRLIGPLARKAHRTASDNLRLAFPELTAAEHTRLLREQWDNLGRTLFEFPLTDRLTPAGGRVEVVGRERLVALAKAGEPAVLIGGHFANWEPMAAAIVDAGVRCRVTYRAANNPYIDRRIIAGRARYGVELFGPKGQEGSREVLRSLEAGYAVALLNDQKFNGGVLSPLFGVPAHTAAGPTRLALRFGGRLHPMSCRRLPGARFRVVVHEPITLTRTGSREADLRAGVEAVNAWVEGVVRERPAEWFWTHRRWPAEAYAALRQLSSTKARKAAPRSSARRGGPS